MFFKIFLAEQSHNLLLSAYNIEKWVERHCSNQAPQRHDAAGGCRTESPELTQRGPFFKVLDTVISSFSFAFCPHSWAWASRLFLKESEIVREKMVTDNSS